MDKKIFPSEAQERFIVRLPDGMRDRIADAAKVAGRSMNAEIVTRLQASFDPYKLGRLSAQELELQMLELEVKNAELMSQYRLLVVQNEEQHMRERQLRYAKAPAKEIAAAVKARTASGKQLNELGAQLLMVLAQQKIVFQKRLDAAKR